MEKLIERINSLSKEDKEKFDRIYEFKIEEAKQFFPEKIKEKYKEQEIQKIYIFKNKILNQETHFNIQRAKRKEPIQEKFEITYDPFCNPLEETPYDDLGRLENEKAITASNLAKISRDHSLVIFKEHDRENLKKEDIEKALRLASEWFRKKGNKVNLLIWNNGYRAGASIEHPHLQIFSFDTLPAKIDSLYQKLIEYKNKFNSDYFEDLFEIHNKLGLAKKLNEVKIIVNLSPFKDNEIIFLFENLENNLTDVSILLNAYHQISSNFNLLICDSEILKIGFIVDRGESSKINSDIGSLEIYAFSVVGFDILEFTENLFSSLH